MQTPAAPRSPDDKSAPSAIEIPDYLEHDEKAGIDSWEMFVGVGVTQLVQGLSQEFGIDPEIMFGCVLASTAQLMGRSESIILQDRTVTPPFNLMILTPESDPVWTRALLRFPRDEFTDQLIGNAMKDQIRSANKAEKIPKDYLQKIRRISSRIYRENLRPPFEPALQDLHIMLGTPRRGLIESLNRLSAAGRLLLEETIDDDPDGLWRCEGIPTPMASFFWDVPNHQAKPLFRSHPWIGRVPFLMVRTEEPGFPNLQPDLPGFQGLANLHQRVLTKRQSFVERSKRHEIDGKALKPFMRLLHRAQRQTAPTSPLVPRPSWVVELGLKFFLTLQAMQESEKPLPDLHGNCLELAKRFIRLHLRNLSAFLHQLSAENAESVALSRREKQAYRKILEAGRLSPAKLRKSFHHMDAQERDEIVLELLSKGLIRKEGDSLMRSAA